MTDSRSGGAGIIIPQPPYIPQTKKYFVAQAPVIFCTNGTLGIRLSDALSGTCIGLLHRDDYAFPRLDSAKLSFRLEWPAVGGEALSYTHHISNTGRNITVGRLAQKIAKEVGRFIDTYTTSS
ncbi:hypothetical protein AcV7_004700 [Taiwanofungus camphoratus]|nr:hypothetical protein AcV7_004700 [Antrodia cinnamomea]